EIYLLWTPVWVVPLHSLILIFACLWKREKHPYYNLTVKVLRARNIQGTDLLSKADCFVKLRLPTASSITYQTQVVDNSSNPEWNETFQYRIHSAVKNVLELSLFDEDVLINDELTSIVFDVGGIKPGQPLKRTFKLNPEVGNIHPVTKYLYRSVQYSHTEVHTGRNLSTFALQALGVGQGGARVFFFLVWPASAGGFFWFVCFCFSQAVQRSGVGAGGLGGVAFGGVGGAAFGGGGGLGQRSVWGAGFWVARRSGVLGGTVFGGAGSLGCAVWCLGGQGAWVALRSFFYLGWQKVRAGPAKGPLLFCTLPFLAGILNVISLAMHSSFFRLYILCGPATVEYDTVARLSRSDIYSLSTSITHAQYLLFSFPPID
uniref:phospholipase A2 n=1 Tax=Gopherus evgoodei TaxID=1825980 RepID=A0A8C4Y269_9SAUR